MSTTPPALYLGEGEANDQLDRIEAGSVRLVNTSPRYLDLIDYTEGDEGWRPRERESVVDYADEHLRTCEALYRVLAADATVCLEIDDYRVPRAGRLILLSDLWAEMLEAVGFRIAEKVTLVRPLAMGHRSGHFKRYRGAAGYYLPDNVTSEMIVAFKGDPLARIRRDRTEADRVEMAWADRFLRNMWMLAPPRARRARNHPVPQDAEAVRAAISFYSLTGDVVLDPFAGSGTTGAIARSLGRRAILLERVPEFAEAIRRTLDAQPLVGCGRPVQVAGSQLWLDFDPVAEAAARRAFLARSTLPAVSGRVRKMAAMASDEMGVRIPAEVMALAMMAERWHCRNERAA